MEPAEPKHIFHSHYWESLLSGEDSSLSVIQRIFRRFPSPPRCKLCNVPFSGPWSPVFRLFGFRRWALNQQMCRFCLRDMEKNQGGAEIDVSLIYVDVRGSTAIAENMTPKEFTATLNRYLSVVSFGVDEEDGIIDHMAGDGVMAMWIPGFVGRDHARRAVDAALRIAENIEKGLAGGEGFPAGIGVHTGRAYVGVVGEPGSRDFTVIGDPANTVARLSSVAGPGEVVISETAADRAGIDTTEMEHRLLELKGKAEPFPAWVWKASEAKTRVG